MKTKIKFLLTLMLVTSVSASLLSCGGDDDNGGNNDDSYNHYNPVETNLIGKKWVNVQLDAELLSEETCNLYFVDETNGLDYTTTKYYDTNTSSSTPTPFTYEINGNTIYISYSRSSIKMTYYETFLLYEAGEEIFEANSITSADREIIFKYAYLSGEIGTVKYEYDARYKWLTFSGSGSIPDYIDGTQPWKKKDVEEIRFEGGITSIGAYAFYGMESVKDITLSNSVESIGDYAFSRTGIEQLFLSESVVSLGKGAFAECLSLTELYLGTDENSKLEIIGEEAFVGCAVAPKYYSDLKRYSTFRLPPNVKIIGNGAFLVNKIGEIELNEKLEVIGSNVFAEATGKLVIPNSVKSIGDMAFISGKFSEITIGTGLERLGSCPFGEGTNNGKMYVNRGVPIEVAGSLFLADNGESYYTLYVPKGCKSAYKSVAPWKNFKSIIEDSSLEPGGGMPDNGGEGTDDEANLEVFAPTGSIQGYDYVDLGLSVKWATYNVGAVKVDDYGDYYGWGDPTGTKTSNNKDDYPSANPPLSISGTKYDIAFSLWGSDWRLPKWEEINELDEKCTWTWVTVNGISGYKVSNNGRSIFLPAAGYKSRHSAKSASRKNEYGYYWSGELSNDWISTMMDSKAACYMGFHHSSVYGESEIDRQRGYSVRPVTDRN